MARSVAAVLLSMTLILTSRASRCSHKTGSNARRALDDQSYRLISIVITAIPPASTLQSAQLTGTVQCSPRRHSNAYLASIKTSTRGQDKIVATCISLRSTSSRRLYTYSASATKGRTYYMHQQQQQQSF